MNSKALTEVYDIIDFMSDEYQNQIPYRLKEYIKNNRDPLYNSGITELPDTIDNLEEDTKVFLGIIYEKYFLNTELDVSNDVKNEIIQKCQERELQIDNKEEMPVYQNETALLVKKESIIDKIKQLIERIKNFFKK